MISTMETKRYIIGAPDFNIAMAMKSPKDLEPASPIRIVLSGALYQRYTRITIIINKIV